MKRHVKNFNGFKNKPNTVFENYESTSWADMINGKEVTITIQDVQNYLKNTPIIEISVDEIKDMCVHKLKTDDVTLQRVMSADLNYPIIISKDLNGEYNMILDGHHRLQKAINTKQKTIKAKVLDLKNVSKEWQFMFR